MSDIIEKIIQDLQKGCKDIDDFNKDLLKNIDKSNKEVLEFIAKLVKLSPSNAARSPGPSRSIWNPFDGNIRIPSDTDLQNQSNGGIWNPFDD